MIQKLEKKDLERVRQLFEELNWNLITSAVIDGTSPGKVYADRVEKPRTAFMCTVEGYYMAGDSNNKEFNAFLNRLIFERIFAGDTVARA